MSHLVQMAGLTVQNFLSAATGIALGIAVTRAFSRASAATLGNFWVDLVRATLITALAFALTGVPQTLASSVKTSTLEGAKQTIALGPVASREAIKQLGTNGGGFFNANAAHPYENPDTFSNMLSIWSMLLISTALAFTFGRMVGDMRQGVALLSAMARHRAILLIEGKEVRFGQAMTALYVAVTTGLSCGAVNAMHDSPIIPPSPCAARPMAQASQPQLALRAGQRTLVQRM